ncbi:hypothetical protein CMK14_23275 [Candidatus Poribacteria bacterium]|nr:hypothetical protein [Candidatus Poribacteria bacterium]
MLFWLAGNPLTDLYLHLRESNMRAKPIEAKYGNLPQLVTNWHLKSASLAGRNRTSSVVLAQLDFYLDLTGQDFQL